MSARSRGPSPHGKDRVVSSSSSQVPSYAAHAHINNQMATARQPDFSFTSDSAPVTGYDDFSHFGMTTDASTLQAGANPAMSPFVDANSHLNFYNQNAAFSSHNALSPNYLDHRALSPSNASMLGNIGSEGYLSDNSQFASPNLDATQLGDQFGTQLNINETLDPAFSSSYSTHQFSQPGMNTVPDYDSPTYDPTLHVGSQMGLISSQVTNGPFANGTYGSITGSQGNANSQPAGPLMSEYMMAAHDASFGSAGVSSAVTSSMMQPTMQSQQHRGSHPIVRVEYSKDDTTPFEAPSPTQRKRSAGGKRSTTHLTPYADDDTTDDEDQQPAILAQERNDDGSWKASTRTGHVGLDPGARGQFEQDVPSLNEQEQDNLKSAKALEITSWLDHSDVGSDTGNPNGHTSQKKPVNRRRAKSFNDVKAAGLGLQVPQFDDSGIPGPGAMIYEHSEYDAYEDESNFADGDEYGDDEDHSPGSPPADINLMSSLGEGSYFPPDASSQIVFRQPFAPNDNRLPETANAAMMRFKMRALEIDNASMAPTVGSRRKSESEIGSLYHAAGVMQPPTLAALRGMLEKEKKKERKPSFLDGLIPKRSNSNVSKRKGSQPVASQPADTGEASSKGASGSATPPKRKASGTSKISKVDTNIPNSTKDTTGAVTNPLTPSRTLSTVRRTLSRARSKSDLQKATGGLASLMTRHGGPPMLSLASPAAENEQQPQIPPFADHKDDNGDDDSNADEDMAHEAIMDLLVRTDPIIPTIKGFNTHARQLNPRLAEYMVERVTHEQMRRYKRLLEFRVKHEKAVAIKGCPSGDFCQSGQKKTVLLPPKTTSKDGEPPFAGFIVGDRSSDEEEKDLEGTTVIAQFPQGVPLPPVKRLPAEFECPLCFKVKKFYKPSDWTKHVHEDVQPFTCTFPNCADAKSFKRKADWVRHENERHRQLEFWTCNRADCAHVCYRKDNFVQHLVREHKLQEPRSRSVKPGSIGASIDDVGYIVEQCRRDTTKQPNEEPCRFCNNMLGSWKKLTVHLAKHMEQISMPILQLVEQKSVQADTIISPIEAQPQQRLDRPRQSVASPHSPVVGGNFAPMNSNSNLAGNVTVQHSQYNMHRARVNPLLAQMHSSQSYPGALHNSTAPTGSQTIPLPSQQQWQNSNHQFGSANTPITTYDTSSTVFQSPVDQMSFSNGTYTPNFVPTTNGMSSADDSDTTYAYDYSQPYDPSQHGNYPYQP